MGLWSQAAIDDRLLAVDVDEALERERRPHRVAHQVLDGAGVLGRDRFEEVLEVDVRLAHDADNPTPPNVTRGP